MRAVLSVFLLLFVFSVFAQNVESFGVFGGFNFPFTIDQGLSKDPRFVGKFTIRATPVGLSYGYDWVGNGILLTPNFTQIGQQFIIKNTIGGEVGVREVKMSYASVPVALKIHINDMSFFRLSLIAAVSPSFLLKGEETLTIKSPGQATKLRYPAGVSIPTGDGYEQVYDGVFVPQLAKEVYVATDKFNTFQLFAALGIRADFDLNEAWSLNFDGRANFGISDSRKSAYINELKEPAGPEDIAGNPGAPDIYGQRREVFISISFGISKIFKIKNDFKPKVTTHSGRFKAANPGRPRSTGGAKKNIAKRRR